MSSAPHTPRGEIVRHVPRTEIPRPEAPSLGDALEHVVEAGHDLILQRIDLQAERMLERIKALMLASAGMVVGGIVALAGWFLFAVGVVEALSAFMPHATAAMVIGLLHVAIGAGVAVFVHRQQPPPPPPDA